MLVDLKKEHDNCLSGLKAIFQIVNFRKARMTFREISQELGVYDSYTIYKEMIDFEKEYNESNDHPEMCSHANPLLEHLRIARYINSKDVILAYRAFNGIKLEAPITKEERSRAKQMRLLDTDSDGFNFLTMHLQSYQDSFLQLEEGFPETELRIRSILTTILCIKPPLSLGEVLHYIPNKLVKTSQDNVCHESFESSIQEIPNASVKISPVESLNYSDTEKNTPLSSKSKRRRRFPNARRLYSHEEREHIINLIQLGWSDKRIGRDLGRSPQAIYSFRWRLNNHPPSPKTED